MIIQLTLKSILCRILTCSVHSSTGVISVASLSSELCQVVSANDLVYHRQQKPRANGAKPPQMWGSSCSAEDHRAAQEQALSSCSRGQTQTQPPSSSLHAPSIVARQLVEHCTTHHSRQVWEVVGGTQIPTPTLREGVGRGGLWDGCGTHPELCNTMWRWFNVGTIFFNYDSHTT